MRYQTARELRQVLDGILTQPVAPENAGMWPREPQTQFLEPAEEKEDLPPAPKSQLLPWVLAVMTASAAGLFF